MTDRDAILAFLCIATSLNLALLVRLWSKMPASSAMKPDLMFPAGVQVSAFAGTARSGETVEISSTAGTAYAMTFLSRGCPKCRGAVPDVVATARHCAGQAVSMWIATDERLTAKELGQPLKCEDLFLDISKVTYSMLNPRHFSPGYLFIGADLVVQASGAIGDENWRSFAAQVEELSEERATASMELQQ